VVELDENKTDKKWLDAVEKTEPIVREQKVGKKRFSDIKRIDKNNFSTSKLSI
jgi:hypothetical protein